MNINDATRRRILDICAERNITLNKLCTICGITQSTLNNFISAENNTTTISTIKKICDGVNISIQEFFNSPLFENLEQEVK